MKGEKLKKVVLWFAVLCLVAGLGFLFFYPLKGWYEQREQQDVVEQFKEQHKTNDSDTSDKQTSSEDTSKNSVEQQKLYEDVSAYNQQIYAEQQTNLKDAWSYEQPPFRLGDYGIEGEIYGVLTIPTMNIELPVYLGATKSNMAKGAAILGQTSVPTGQTNSNAVIAAHRGFGAVPMFRKIETLAPGDKVYFDNPWERLVYTVESTEVILPDQTDTVKIQEGRDLLTLITCHPYGKNSHRYVVFCTRNSEETVAEEKTTESERGRSADRSEDEKAADRQMLLERYLPIAAVPLIIAAVILLLFGGKKGKRKGTRK